jgi:dihydroflavonol-4-reductase
MQALVTGATGHIGANIVHELVSRGHEVRVLARDPAGLVATRGLKVDEHKGDVLDDKTLRPALEGVEVLFHAAAVYRNWTKDPDEMGRVAREGTTNVLRAAKDAGVRRVVYTSSSNCVGFTKDVSHPPDETVWNETPHAPYVRAKVETEKLAHALAKELGLDLVAVLPTGVLGRFDYRATPTTQMFLDVVNRRGPIGFALNPVDVRDVAVGHVLAAEKGKPGERYLLGGDNVDVATLATLVREEIGIEPKVGMPPGWVLATVAAVAEAVSSLTGKEPMMTSAMVREIRSAAGIVFDCGKQKRELGLEARGGRDVIREAVRWLGFLGKITDPEVAARVKDKLPPDPAWPAPPAQA